MNYVPLYIKTDYSILRSLIKIDDLINKLLLLDIKACCICDDNLFGVAEFYNKCLKNDIKPIIGLEINIEYPVLLYAKNYKGYQNLCNIDTIKNTSELTYDKLYDYLDDVIVVVPYIYKDRCVDLKNKAVDFFIGYSNIIEKNDINDKAVFIKKTLCFDKEDEKYLKYLYKIDDEEFDLKDVSFEEEVIPEIKKDTMYFSSLCELVIPKHDDLLPVYNSDKDFDASKYLTDLCIIGLKKRLDNKVPVRYVDRLKYELGIINKMNFCNYFLVVWDYVKYAKKNDILVGPGRGSAASSLVSYSLGITNIDPLKYDLLFERFLNPERITMPDIDIDFDADKRGEVIKYVINKYGSSNVSSIITFSNLLAKQVIRDLARIFDVSTFKIDGFLKNFDDKKNLREQLNNIGVKRMLHDDETIRKIYDIALHLEGLKRHTSIHAAGIIISSKKLSNYVPLTLNSDNSLICGYQMNYIEDFGLLKMDFLGLKNLTIIDKIIKRVGIDFDKIPLDDKKTYELFSKGYLDDVFQFESPGMRKFIMELKPDTIDDLVAAVALFRPGPIDNIPTYIKRKHGKEKVTYLHEDLEDILKSTYGIIIYQEQIMQIANKLAGFSYGEADVLRRAMSKKKEDILLSKRDKFVNQSVSRGYEKCVAKEVYDLILKFANYGFNKAHSVCYAIIGYKIAYLKVHYPLEFMCEVLNNYIGVSNKTKSILTECKRLGVEITKPTINTSKERYDIVNGKLVYPFSMIKGIGTLTARNIIEDRNNNGDFISYYDFVKRTYKLGKDVVRNIILSGALDYFGETKKTYIENLDEVINYAELCNDLDETLVIKPELKQYEEYTKEELTKQEESLYGFYISNHPTNKYINDDSITSDKLDKYFDKYVNMILYFERKKDINTKNNEKMMFITASDTYGTIDLVMFPKTYNKYFNIPFPGIYKVYGKVEKRFSKLQVIISSIEKINE